MNLKLDNLMNAFIWGFLAGLGAIVAYVVANKIGLI